MRRLLAAAALVATKDLRSRARDRSALIVGFAAPFALAAIISLGLGGTGSFRPTFAVFDGDGGPVGASFVRTLREGQLRDVVTVREVASADEARELVAGGKANAGFAIPAGFGAAALAGAPARLTVVRSADSPVSGEVAASLADTFTIALASAAGTAGRAAGAMPRLVDASIGTREVKAASYFGPSMAVFFLFFTVEFGVLGLLAERRIGTLARLLAAPVPSEAVILGKAAAAFVLGSLSLATMIVATTALLGASWGDPLAVAALAAAAVLAAMGITALLATFASTEERARGASSIVAVTLSLLGGSFLRIDQAPEILRNAALLTPNGLALRGFVDLVADGGGIATVLPHIAGVLAIAVATGGVALRRARRLVVA